jgi:hypothetical protein
MKLRFNFSVLNNCIILLMLSSISAHRVLAKPTLDVSMQEKGQRLVFDLNSSTDRIQQNQIKINLSEDKKNQPLLLIEVANVAVSTKWFVKFDESKYSDIKGILLRKKTGGAQLRIRYLKGVAKDFTKQVRIRQTGTQLSVSIPTKAISVNPTSSRSTDKPDPKVQRVREITSALKDEGSKKSSTNIKTSTRPKKTTPSPLEQSTHSPPLPPTAQMRRVGQPTNPTTSQIIQPQVVRPRSSQPSFVPQNNPGTTIPNIKQNNMQERPLSQNQIKPQRPPNKMNTKTPKKVSNSPSKIDSLSTSNPLGGLTEEPFKDWHYWVVAGLFFVVAFIFLAKGKKQSQLSSISPNSANSVLSFAEQHIKQQNQNMEYNQQNQIHVLSEKVINHDPVQKVIVVEVGDQKLLIGSADNAGLSFLTNLTHPVPQVVSQASNEVYDGSYDEYRNHYPSAKSYPESRPVQPLHDARNEYYDEGMQDYAENTYVNESGAYTDELSALHPENIGMEAAHDHYPTRNITQRAQEAFKPESNHYLPANNSGLGDLNPLIEEVQDSSYQSEADPADDVEDVSADDLLQKIRQLNRG